MPAARRPRHAGALVLALLATTLAGCVDDAQPAASLPPPSAEDGSDPALAPDGRELVAFDETNRTEEGLGGVDHAHDYWQGRDRVDIVAGDYGLLPIPFFADGDPARSTTDPISAPPPGLVYEGTAQVEVLVSDPRVYWHTVAPYPATALKLLYLTAKDGAGGWRDGGPVTLGTPTVIPVAPDETDMPHSVASLWAFQLVSDGPHAYSVNVTVTAVRGNDVPAWPGHPDFYAERTTRVVFDGDASTKKTGVADILLTGDGTNWNSPDRLVSWGTGELHVFANITRYDTPGGAPAAGFFLEVHNASSFAYLRLEDAAGNNDLKSYHFVVPVDVNGMDSPYASASRWGFRVLAVFTDVALPTGGGLGLCPGCFPYTIDYHMTVVAVAADALPPAT